MVVLVAVIIPHQKWLLYTVLILVNVLNNIKSWTAPFLVGLGIAELSVNGKLTNYHQGKTGLVTKSIFIFLILFLMTIDFWDLYKNESYSNLMKFLSYFTIGSQDIPTGIQMSLVDLVVATLFLLLVEISSFLRKFFGSRPFRFLGKISFGLYLLHPVVYTSFTTLVFVQVFDPASGIPVDWGKMILIVSSLLVLFPLSYMFYYIADDPSIRFGRWVEVHCFQTEWSLEKVRNFVLCRPDTEIDLV
jgi:peptidoglycan/LPS O-acetylase OafA/YrhL